MRPRRRVAARAAALRLPGRRGRSGLVGVATSRPDSSFARKHPSIGARVLIPALGWDWVVRALTAVGSRISKQTCVANTERHDTVAGARHFRAAAGGFGRA